MSASTPSASSHLSLELTAGKAVSARSLARALKLTLPAARQAMIKYQTRDADVGVTWVLIGTLKASAQAAGDDAMQVDESQGASQEASQATGETTAQRQRIVIVSNDKLEAAKASLINPTVQIYALLPPTSDSSSTLGALAALRTDVRALGPESLDAVVGNTKKLAPTAARPAPLASASTNAQASKAASTKAAAPAVAKPAKKEEEKAGKKGKSATLDWSKAKPSAPAASSSKSASKSKPATNKRKSRVVESESEEEDEDALEAAGPPPGDDEEEDEVPEKIGYSAEDDAQDVDMDEPEEVVAESSKSAKAKAAEPAEEAGPSTSTTTGAKKRVRKQRVVVRKERSKDAKGYTVTKDVEGYESYSSDESDAPAPTTSAGKAGRAKPRPSAGKKKAVVEDSPSPQPEPAKTAPAKAASSSKPAPAKAAPAAAPAAKPAPAPAKPAPAKPAAAKSSSAPKKAAGQQKLSAFFGKPKPK